MAEDADELVVEFVDGPRGMQGVATGPWRGEQDERMALDLLGALRVDRASDVSLGIFDVGHSDCRWYATFEAVTGVDLTDLRRILADPADTTIAPYAVYHLCRFLEVVGHDWSHITRPEHVILTAEADLRVAYFEAYTRGSCDSLIDRDRDSTDWHDMLAPELFGTEDRTETMMVYALGIMLVYLVTGRRPLRRASARTTVTEAIERTTPMSALVDLPPPLSLLINSATHPSANHRTTNLAAFADQLAPHVPHRTEVARALQPIMIHKGTLQDDRVRFCM